MCSEEVERRLGCGFIVRKFAKKFCTTVIVTKALKYTAQNINVCCYKSLSNESLFTRCYLYSYTMVIEL